MAKRKRNYMSDAITLNCITFDNYYNQLKGLCLSTCVWSNMPESIDVDFMEWVLYHQGACVFFYDDVMGYLCLPLASSGNLNVYNKPINYTVQASNGYRRALTEKNSVIIYDNIMHNFSDQYIRFYAQKITNIERTIDINVNAQKTPIILSASEQQRLTISNLYQKYDGNEPIIYGDKGLDVNGLKCIKTDAPYISDKLYELKTNVWNEALTYIGITNVQFNKKERLITDEVNRSLGGTYASRNTRLLARENAVARINNMFNLNISVSFTDEKVGDVSE